VNGQSLWKVRKVGPATQVSPIGEPDKPEVVYELLGGSPADLLFPNNFLIVEGRSEEVLIGRIVQRFYAEQPRIKVVFSGGDFERQQKSMDAIDAAFTPLNRTPVYSKRLVILCDKPNAQRAKDFEKFCTGYPHLKANNQLVVAPVCALEEAYPVPWKKTADDIAKLSPRDKTDLAALVGRGIAQEQFEHHLAHVFHSLQIAWANAHR
jgi:hypothetical protein